ncbi:MAG: phage holin family protein [Gammaproteobacteria bacterium]|nr:phage holin family protein [Gammaproteobacteria bacterium]
MGQGLFASLRRMLATLIELVHVRLDLVGVELQLEVDRATNALLYGFAAVLCAVIALVMLAVTVLIAYWDTHRLLAACCITGLFAVAAASMFLHLRYRARTRPRLFESTVQEMQRDAAALRDTPP